MFINRWPRVHYRPRVFSSTWTSRSAQTSCAWVLSRFSRVQLCATPWTVHGIFQARILEWVAVLSSRGSSRPKDQIYVYCGSCIAGRFFMADPLRKPPNLPDSSRYKPEHPPVQTLQFTRYSLLHSCQHPHSWASWLQIGFPFWTQLPWLWPLVLSEKTDHAFFLLLLRSFLVVLFWLEAHIQSLSLLDEAEHGPPQPHLSPGEFRK